MRIFWLTLGILSLFLGIVGIVVPLLPTTVFVLLAAYSFARSSRPLHDWLVNHPRLGPLIRDWHANGAIRRPAKVMATVSIGAMFLLSIALGVANWVVLLQAVVFFFVLLFIWTRPTGAST